MVTNLDNKTCPQKSINRLFDCIHTYEIKPSD